MVEVRQHRRRPKTETTNAGWAETKQVTMTFDNEPRRVAAAAFKSVEVTIPSETVVPPVRPGRILPSLEEAKPLEAPSEAPVPNEKARLPKAPKVKPPAAVAKVEAVSENVPIGQSTAPKRRLTTEPSEPIRVSQVSEPASDFAAIFSTNAIPTPRKIPRKAKAPAVLKKSTAPAEPPEAPYVTAAVEPEPIARSETTTADPAPNSSTSAEPSSGGRKRTILSRYVFRDELKPGEKWKRRLLSRSSGRS
jgi:hypothetical protein